MFKRTLGEQIIESLSKGQVTILYGPRQIGKTTLAESIRDNNVKSIYLNCDDPTVRSQLHDQGLVSLRRLIGDASLVVIDEAQRVENIGLTLKLIHDEIPLVKQLVTGSSSLEPPNMIKEPLTGRAREFLLRPLSILELTDHTYQANSLLESLMVIGGYPGVHIRSLNDSQIYLREIATNYLYRDLVSLGVSFRQRVIEELLRLLAFQIGSEVNFSELASSLEVSKETVMRYIDLLEKSFIIFRVEQYRKNLRSKIGRKRKIYFYDLGIRNAIIDNLKPLQLRNDVGALWENFIVCERLKAHQTFREFVRIYYWRSRDLQEVDLVEEYGDKLVGIECKWKSQPKFPSGFSQAIPEAKQVGITKYNYQEYVYSSTEKLGESVELKD